MMAFTSSRGRIQINQDAEVKVTCIDMVQHLGRHFHGIQINQDTEVKVTCIDVVQQLGRHLHVALQLAVQNKDVGIRVACFEPRMFDRHDGL